MPKKSKPKTKEEEDFEKIKEKHRIVYFDAERREVKSLKEIFEVTTKVQEVFIPKLGCSIKVGHLGMKEFTKITEKLNPKDPKDQMAFSMEMLYYILKSADKTVTREYVEGIPYHIATEIITLVIGGDQSGFQEDSTLPTVLPDT